MKGKSLRKKGQKSYVRVVEDNGTQKRKGPLVYYQSLARGGISYKKKVHRDSFWGAFDPSVGGVKEPSVETAEGAVRNSREERVLERVRVIVLSGKREERSSRERLKTGSIWAQGNTWRGGQEFRARPGGIIRGGHPENSIVCQVQKRGMPGTDWGGGGSEGNRGENWHLRRARGRTGSPIAHDGTTALTSAWEGMCRGQNG